MSLVSSPNFSRKRTINFSCKEVEILINLVGKYKGKIECRKTDRTSNNAKNETWLHLAKEFNGISGEAYRDAKILRNKYENIKKRSKQRFADEKMYRRGTGGGPEKPFVITEVDEKLKDIIGSQMTGLVSEFGGDQEDFPSNASVDIDMMDGSQLGDVYQTQAEIESYESGNEEEGVALEMLVGPTSCSRENSSSTSCSKYELLQPDIFNTLANSSKDISGELVQAENKSKIKTSIASPSGSKQNYTATTWAKYIPSQLRTPKSTPLKTTLTPKKYKENGKCSSQSQLSNRVITWASDKAEIAGEHLKFLREEHELKLKQMREKHELNMTIAREESEERRRYFVLQAELQLEVLRQQLQKK